MCKKIIGPFINIFLPLGVILLSEIFIAYLLYTTPHAIPHGDLIGILLILGLIFIYLVYLKYKHNLSIDREIHHLHNKLIEQDKLAALGVLSAGIAHEIKNPLNFINNFSELSKDLSQEIKNDFIAYQKHPDNKNAQILLQSMVELESNICKIQEHGKRAEYTIKNMLLQSRTESKEKSDVDINHLLEEYLNLAYHGMRAVDADFNIKIEKSLDTNLDKIYISPQAIGRVFLNIINNSFYATHELKKTNYDYQPLITVITKQNTDSVIIKIKDNGSGIAEHELEKIFEPFYTTKPQDEGTGLGLPICHDIIVNDHQGKISVQSKPGQYTEFTICLPKHSDKQ